MFFLSLFLTSGLVQGAAVGATQPNIVLILTDDQGWGDLSHHGNTRLSTPNMDAIAREGVSFDRFYVNPVCAPTRASLLTGRYSLRTGVHNVTRGEETLRSEELTLAEALGQAGYATGAFGKWHNGAHYPHTANGQGFDEFFGFNAGHWSQYFDARLQHNGEPVTTRGYITDVITDRALSFIEEHQRRPFFAYIPYNAPHSPFQVPDSYFAKYQRLGFDDRTASIYGMVENIDDNIGRILARLTDLQLRERTIVIFLSDNGPHGSRYNGGMRAGKGSVHEGGVRVPLFVHWPRHIEGGRTIDTPAQHIDIFPTLMALSATTYSGGKPIDGRNLAPLLTGRERELPQRYLFSHKFSMGAVVAAPGAVRTGRWVATLEGDRWSLFDIVNDHGQTADLAGRHPKVMARLASAYREWFADVTSQGFQPVPIAIGHRAAPEVDLPAHEAYLQGENIRYAGGEGWAHAWLTGWSDPDSYPYWHIEVKEEGDYALEMVYAMAKDLPTRLAVEVGNRRLAVVEVTPHRRHTIEAPDRAPRYSVFDQTWGRVSGVAVRLKKGSDLLSVKALSTAGGPQVEIKSLRLRRIEAGETNP